MTLHGLLRYADPSGRNLRGDFSPAPMGSSFSIAPDGIPPEARAAREHHPHAAATARAGAQSGRKNLAILVLELTLEQDLQEL